MICNSCGGDIHSHEPVCKYCGAENHDYVAPARKESSEDSRPQPQNVNVQPVRYSGFNVGVFILLLIFFWPAAIIYAIVRSRR